MRRLSIIAWVTAAAMMASCGGGSTTIGTASTSTGTGGTGGTGTTKTVLSMGSGTGASFQSGALAISTKSLSAGGSTSLQVELVDQTGALYTTATAITFSSPCQAQGLATIVATGVTPASPTVTTSTGSASATYSATGCSGSDVITATASANSQTLSATGTVTVAQAAIGSISFISAKPSNITLKGVGSTGGSATSTVIFKVLDTSGGPRAGATVTFSLNTSVGGITMSPTSATTDVNGQVQTIVSGGTVATTVRVTAATTTAAGATISTQSNALTVSTGIPTSHNISLAVLCQNVEAFDLDGVIVPVTVRMTDRFSNPVPDGTTANFQTTLGGIQGTCLTASTATESGVCSVNWVSKDPRTVNGVTNGRSPLLVSAIGEESFIDANGNGIFDPGDTVPFNSTLSTKAWDDTQEPFLNVNEHFDANGIPVYDAGDPFIDFNNNHVHDGPDGMFNGPLCQGPLCSSQTSVAIGASNIIIMSGSQAVFTPASGTFTIGTGATLTFVITDARGQQMPAKTTVAASVSTNAGQFVGATTYNWPCTSAPGGQAYSFSLIPTTTPQPGVLFITVTTPGGLVTTASYSLTD